MEQISEYQLCPKCLGEGKVLNTYVSAAWYTICDVCNGTKTLIKPVINQQSEAIEFADWLVINYWEETTEYKNNTQLYAEFQKSKVKP